MKSLYHPDIKARVLANKIYAIQQELGLVLPQGTPVLHTFLHTKPVMGRVASGELPFGLGISPLEEIVVDFYGHVLGSQRRSSVECLKDWEPYKEDLPKLETLIMAFGDIDDYFKVNYFREDYHGLSILEKSARINCAETGLSDVFSNQPADVLAFLAFYRSGINVDHVTRACHHLGS